MFPGLRVAEHGRASVGEWVQTTLLVVNLAWTTLCLGGYRPETMQVTLALSGALFAIHFAVCASERRPIRATSPAGWGVIPFLLYACASVTFVTPVPWLGWLDWLGWANMAVVFWVTLNGVQSRLPRRVLFLALVLLGILAVLMASYQRFAQPRWLMLGREQADQFLDRSSGPFGIPNSLAGLLILLLPATGALAFRQTAGAAERVWWVWVTAVLGFGLWLTMSRGGWIALALALLCWPLASRRLKWSRRALIALVALAAMVSAGALLQQVSPAFRERFGRLVRESGELSRPILWRAAEEIFRAHPISGGGAGSYNVLFELHRPPRFLDEPRWAHNEYLNTLSDYGIVGIVLLGAGLMVAVRQHKRDRRPDPADPSVPAPVSRREGLGVGVLAFALQLFVDFHLKIPALAMAFAVISALALRPRTPAVAVGQITPGGTRAGWLLAGVAAVIALFPILRFHHAEALRYRAREKLDHVTDRRTQDLTLLDQAETHLRRAASLAPRHAAVWSDLAHTIELRAFVEPARVRELAESAFTAANRAVHLGAVVPEFWIRLGLAFDMQARRREATNAFENAVKLAPQSSQAWYYYAHHLSLATEDRQPALRAIAKCLSLDPGNAAAEALRVKLNERS